MRVATILCALALTLVSACSTNRRQLTSSVQTDAPRPEPSPIGEFILAEIPWPQFKLRINSDGTYMAEERSLIEFWPMIEGNKVYPQPIRPVHEKGHWTWNRTSGELILTRETKQKIDEWYRIDRLQYSRTRPDYLASARGTILKRVELPTDREPASGL
jgi:hypothetical protein